MLLFLGSIDDVIGSQRGRVRGSVALRCGSLYQQLGPQHQTVGFTTRGRLEHSSTFTLAVYEIGRRHLVHFM